MPEITLHVVLGCLLIIGARIADVSLGTIRTVAVINGRRLVSWSLGFVEVLIWILVVSRVIQTINEHPLYPIAYALGFATGNFVGITIEGRLAFGERVVRVFTRRGAELAVTLRGQGYGVTEFDGRGRDGPVSILFVVAKRRQVDTITRAARAQDPECFYVVDDIRVRSDPGRGREGQRGK